MDNDGAQSKPILRLEDIHLSFGGVKAINGVTCEVRGNEIFGIIGPNGAGKTSTLNCINGFLPHPEGRHPV